MNFDILSFIFGMAFLFLIQMAIFRFVDIEKLGYKKYKFIIIFCISFISIILLLLVSLVVISKSTNYKKSEIEFEKEFNKMTNIEKNKDKEKNK